MANGKHAWLTIGSEYDTKRSIRSFTWRCGYCFNTVTMDTVGSPPVEGCKFDGCKYDGLPDFRDFPTDGR